MRTASDLLRKPWLTSWSSKILLVLASRLPACHSLCQPATETFGVLLLLQFFSKSVRHLKVRKYSDYERLFAICQKACQSAVKCQNCATTSVSQVPTVGFQSTHHDPSTIIRFSSSSLHSDTETHFQMSRHTISDKHS